ncbi:hypothetical protein NBRC116591_06220 [Sessilibacter corallicola]|uniref:CAAX prenyl protease 2/Lysostaphin resistance protein A-like domain-containing protein n=2 Tax=Sessilibacter corallicola TaxID=2904075 RepID=A0ABQ0A583_9GAMM
MHNTFMHSTSMQSTSMNSTLNQTQCYRGVLFSGLILVLGFILSQLSFLSGSQLALLALITLLLLAYAKKPIYKQSRLWQLLIFPIIAAAFVIATTKSSDIIKPSVFYAEELYPGGKPFHLQLNVGKTLAGYLLLIWLLPLWLNNQKRTLSIRKSTIITLAFTSLIISTAWVLLDLDIHLKHWVFIALFLPVNLLTTCVAEEAFIRLSLQKPLEHFLASALRSSVIIKGLPIVITTVLFVALHGVSEISGIITFALAGLLYGLVYTLTNRLLFTILLHFAVNALHFIFLTYPI